MKLSISLGAAATMVLFALAAWSLSPLGFLSSDTGLRMLQIYELIEHGWSTFAIDYPGRFADPELRYVPYYYAYAVVDGRIFLSISPFFPLLASLGFARLGAPGLALVPVLGTLLAAWGTRQLVRSSRLPHADLAFLGVMFGTPLLFYSTQLWDHTLATGLAICAIYGIARGVERRSVRSLVLGGLAMGLAMGQRPEMYVLCLALGASVLIVTWSSLRPVALAALGGAIGALPLWLLQHVWYGHPLGIVMARRLLGYGATAYAARPPTHEGPAFLTEHACLLIHTSPFRMHATVTASILIGVGTAILVYLLRANRPRDLRLLWGGLAISLAGYALLAFAARELLVGGLVATFPLLPLSLSQPGRAAQDADPGRQTYRIALWTVSLFVAGMLALWPACGGLQWGSRYLLPAYPLLLYLAIRAYSIQQSRLEPTRGAHLRRFALVLVALSLLLQLQSVRLVFVHSRNRAEAAALIARVPARVILTNDMYFASSMSPLRNKTFLYVRDDQALREILPSLVRSGVRRVAILPMPWTALRPPPEAAGHAVRAVGPYLYELAPK